MTMQRRTFVLHASALAAGVTLPPGARAATHGSLVGLGYPASIDNGYPSSNSIVVAWNRALTSAIAATRTQATIAARACSMVHEAIYNAWAAYDAQAAFTLASMRKQPSGANLDLLAIAISWAACDVLVDLFASQATLLVNLRSLVATNAWSATSAGTTARQVGQLAASSLLQARHDDASNQLGNWQPGTAYSDYTYFVPTNTPDTIVDISRWQPLRVVDASGATVVQSFLTPFWNSVRPFALASAWAHRPTIEHYQPTSAEMNQLIAYSAALDETSKSLVELWAANPGTVSPPGQWMQIAEQVSAYDNNTLAQDVKLFFATAQAVFDASLAAWDAKRIYNTVRPITAIPYFFRNQTITAWAGFNLGTRSILGQNWRPYQRSTNPTPPFPEYVSGHSTFSAAAANVIAGVRGSDAITITGSVAPGGIGFETNMPSRLITFSWNSLSEAADAAGLSRRIGGIHFEQGDLHGRALGRRVGATVLAKCLALFGGQTGVPSANGTGLRGEYFPNSSFAGTPVLVRTEAIAFDWGTGSPGAGVPSDNFTVRWSGVIEAPITGTYYLATTSDERIRVRVNNTLVIDHWTPHSWGYGYSAALNFVAGQRYPIVVEYADGTGSAVAKLAWYAQGLADTWTNVPANRLYLR